MDLTITVPDELLPGLVAIAYAESTPEAPITPDEIAQNYAIAAATKACQDMKVGPYYVGPINPAFGPDGLPFISPAEEPSDQDTTSVG